MNHWIKEVVRFYKVFGFLPIPTETNKRRAYSHYLMLHRRQVSADCRLFSDRNRFRRLSEPQAVIRTRMLDECERRRKDAQEAWGLLVSFDLEIENDPPIPRGVINLDEIGTENCIVLDQI